MTTTAIAEKEDGRRKKAANPFTARKSIEKNLNKYFHTHPIEMQLFATRLLQKLQDAETDGIPALRSDPTSITVTLRAMSTTDKFNRKLDAFKQFCSTQDEYSIKQSSGDILLFKITAK